MTIEEARVFAADHSAEILETAARWRLGIAMRPAESAPPEGASPREVSAWNDRETRGRILWEDAESSLHELLTEDMPTEDMPTEDMPTEDMPTEDMPTEERCQQAE